MPRSTAQPVTRYRVAVRFSATSSTRPSGGDVPMPSGRGDPGGSRKLTRERAWSRPPRLEGGPSATMWPAAITATRSARNCASSM